MSRALLLTFCLFFVVQLNNHMPHLVTLRSHFWGTTAEVKIIIVLLLFYSLSSGSLRPIFWLSPSMDPVRHPAGDTLLLAQEKSFSIYTIFAFSRVPWLRRWDVTLPLEDRCWTLENKWSLATAPFILSASTMLIGSEDREGKDTSKSLSNWNQRLGNVIKIAVFPTIHIF